MIAASTRQETSGCCAQLYAPSAPIVRNQSTMSGPASRPMSCEPCRCSEKRTSSTPTASAERARSEPSGRPSSAPSTLIAGVIAPSPISRLQPSIASSVTRWRARAPSGGPERMVCSSANVPPSPWWLTRITQPTYLTQTTSVSAQKIIEKVPRMSSGCGSARSSVL